MANNSKDTWLGKLTTALSSAYDFVAPTFQFLYNGLDHLLGKLAEYILNPEGTNNKVVEACKLTEGTKILETQNGCSNIGKFAKYMRNKFPNKDTLVEKLKANTVTLAVVAAVSTALLVCYTIYKKTIKTDSSKDEVSKKANAAVNEATSKDSAKKLDNKVTEFKVVQDVFNKLKNDKNVDGNKDNKKNMATQITQITSEQIAKYIENHPYDEIFASKELSQETKDIFYNGIINSGGSSLYSVPPSEFLKTLSLLNGMVACYHQNKEKNVDLSGEGTSLFVQANEQDAAAAA